MQKPDIVVTGIRSISRLKMRLETASTASMMRWWATVIGVRSLLSFGIRLRAKTLGGCHGKVVFGGYSFLELFYLPLSLRGFGMGSEVLRPL